jgi:hypothetical protein
MVTGYANTPTVLHLYIVVVVVVVGRSWQATNVLQPVGLLYRPLWTFQLFTTRCPRTWVPEASTLTPRPPKPLYIYTYFALSCIEVLTGLIRDKSLLHKFSVIILWNFVNRLT